MKKSNVRLVCSSIYDIQIEHKKNQPRIETGLEFGAWCLEFPKLPVCSLLIKKVNEKQRGVRELRNRI